MCRSIKRILKEKLHVRIVHHVDDGTAALEESCASLRNIVSMAMAAMNDGIIQ